MKKRAQEIFAKEALNLLLATNKNDFNKTLTRFASLADILDQSGNEKAANSVDELLKQASFWSALFSGMAGGSGMAIWEAFKTGKFKENLAKIVKNALMGGVSAVAVEYIIKWLDGVPVLGSLLRELEGADKLRSIIEGIIAGAVTDSDIAQQIVDKSIHAIENMIGVGTAANKQEQASPPKTPEVKPEVKKEEGSDTATFQVAAPGQK